MRKEIDREENSCFAMKQLTDSGQYLHFHGHLEIYWVEKGKAALTVSGDSQVLTQGQMAIVDRYESHSCEMDVDSQVFIVSLGAHYVRFFRSEYPNQRLPRWLTDAGFNRGLHEEIKSCFERPQTIRELKRIGLVCQWLSKMIEHYGLVNKKDGTEADLDLVAEIVGYIYDHYTERITLETLAAVFHLSPTALSKKLGERLGMDLRVFVNDIRVQKAAQMMDDPANRNKTINEIAILCGFSSMSTFYRSYKRNFSLHRLHIEAPKED